MFSLGVFILFAAYAMAYTGIANLLNGGAGPTLSESLGLPMRLAPPGADQLSANPTINTPPGALPGTETNPPPQMHGKGF